MLSVHVRDLETAAQEKEQELTALATTDTAATDNSTAALSADKRKEPAGGSSTGIILPAFFLSIFFNLLMGGQVKI